VRGRLRVSRTPDNRWEGLMGFSENLPFLSGRKFSNFQKFVRKKSGLRPELRNLSGLPIRPPNIKILSGIYIKLIFSPPASRCSICYFAF
jgi:hypothetical protein